MAQQTITKNNSSWTGTSSADNVYINYADKVRVNTAAATRRYPSRNLRAMSFTARTGTTASEILQSAKPSTLSMATTLSEIQKTTFTFRAARAMIRLTRKVKMSQSPATRGTTKFTSAVPTQKFTATTIISKAVQATTRLTFGRAQIFRSKAARATIQYAFTAMLPASLRTIRATVTTRLRASTATTRSKFTARTRAQPSAMMSSSKSVTAQSRSRTRRIRRLISATFQARRTWSARRIWQATTG